MSIEVTTKGKIFLSPQQAGTFAESLINGIVGAIKVTLTEKLPYLSEGIKTSFDSQSLPTGPFPPSYDNTESTRDKKIKDGFDDRVGQETQSLKNSIKLYQRASNRWFVGTRKQAKTGTGSKQRNKRVRLPLYASWLEYGTKFQRARPIFTPHLRAFVPRYQAQTTENIKQFINRLVKTYGA